jgi:hypothetical protein
VVPAVAKTPLPPNENCSFNINDPPIFKVVLLLVGGAASCDAIFPPLASGPHIDIEAPLLAVAPIVLSETTSPATFTVVIVLTPLLIVQAVLAVSVTERQKTLEIV